MRMEKCEKCGTYGFPIGHSCIRFKSFKPEKPIRLEPFDAFRGPGTGLTIMARTDPVMREMQARDPRPGTIEYNFLGQIERIH